MLACKMRGKPGIARRTSRVPVPVCLVGLLQHQPVGALALGRRRAAIQALLPARKRRVAVPEARQNPVRERLIQRVPRRGAGQAVGAVYLQIPQALT